MKEIILASASPRRKELLEQIGISFRVHPAQGEEIITQEEPSQIVMDLSKQKAFEIFEKEKKVAHTSEWLVIGADTMVACGSEILGKPKNEEDAARMIRMMQGNYHQVYTGVTLYAQKKQTELPKCITFFEKADVRVYTMSEDQIEAYVQTGEPMDKAGAYGIQGKFARYIKSVEGEYATIVGFPIARIMQEIQKLTDWKL